MDSSSNRASFDAPASPRDVPGGPSASERAIPSVPEKLPLSTLSGWGRYPVVRGYEVRSENLEKATLGATLTRGLGRSYGDASLPPPGEKRFVVSTPLADRLLAFDSEMGVLRAEAGFSLRRLNEVFLPRGWFTPVTPGTQYVTLGGMVASDVHGKSHHVDGCFGEHVLLLKMRLADGRVIDCSEAQEPELFRATLGGMGLTGHILEVTVRMKKIPTPWIWTESERLPNIEAAVEALKRASQEWPYTVCWTDCLSTEAALGRSILMKGRWAEPHEAPPRVKLQKPLVSVPFPLPSWFLQTWQVRAFNALYYWKHGDKIRRGIQDYGKFFYPLDVVHDWNRLYGKRGFTQYQCVLPARGSDPSVRQFLELLIRKGGTTFLCVLKDCGREGKGMLSFPKPGISFALDIPIRGAETQRLVDALNEFVIAQGGRIYPTKDAFTRAEHYRAMDPRLEAWKEVRRKWDPEGNLRSAQSIRLFGDPA